MSFPVINPTPTFVDSSGSPLTSGTIEFRNPTTNDLINSYPTADDADAQTNANANPLTLSARGEATGLFLEDGVAYKIVLKDSSGATVWTQDDVRCPVVLPDSILTTAESSASLTIADIDITEREGYYKRYKVTGDGSSNDTTALANMLKVGYQGIPLDFGANITIVTDTFVMKDANSNVPPYITGYNVTFQARTGATGVFIQLENPHASWEGFRWDGNFIFDANGLCTSAFLLKGSQRSYFGPMKFVNAVGGPQCRVEAEASFGVFYNTFSHWIAGGSTSEGGNDDGFSIKTTDATNRIASNTWLNPRSNWNEGHGFDIDRCSDVFVGAEAEKNDGEGFNIDNTPSITFIGGYSENNNENMSGGGASDATTDQSFVTTANTNRFMVFGGRHIGDVVDAAIGSGHIILPGRNAGMEITQRGFGINSATAIDNGFNFLNDSDMRFQASGANKFRWDQAADEMVSHVALRVSSTTATISSGTATPEGAVTAPKGSIFLRTDGGGSTTFYVKESGAGNTGWVAK
jgi:hypothetical protein